MTADMEVAGSFRDPSGFVFKENGVLYRQVNAGYAEDYRALMSSGLYRTLVEQGQLIPHEEVPELLASRPDAFLLLRPQPIPFISYPYEWSFSQLRDAALLTLDIQIAAIQAGLSLKDASAFNIQFLNGKPVLIDTLSFERYDASQPWGAYRQFCQHFIAPLALMSQVDIRLSRLSALHIDGLPLDLASRLLPLRSRLNLGLGLHIHAHARSQAKYRERPEARNNVSQKFNRHSMVVLLDSLKTLVRRLKWEPGASEWADYYDANNNYGNNGLEHKETLIRSLLDEISAESAWDIGANTGRFSRLLTERGIDTVSWDIDPSCIEMHYRKTRGSSGRQALPLFLDLTNPTPAVGWENSERLSLEQRGPVSLVLALGLIHHLAISNNVPLSRIAEFLARLSRWVILEFIPKSDSQVQKLLATREDVFPDYSEEGFLTAFEKHFSIQRSEPIPATQRKLFLLQRL